MTINRVINFVAFQAGWLVAVLGAARGYPAAGVVYALSFAVLHHWQVRGQRYAELALMLSAAGFGYLVDSLLVLTGVISFPAHTQLGYPSTLWMVCLWLMFAMTLRHSLGWLRNQHALAAALGTVFGPLAYWTGSQWNAIEIRSGGLTLAAIGITWAISMLALVQLEIATRSVGVAAERRR